MIRPDADKIEITLISSTLAKAFRSAPDLYNVFMSAAMNLVAPKYNFI